MTFSPTFSTWVRDEDRRRQKTGGAARQKMRTWTDCLTDWQFYINIPLTLMTAQECGKVWTSSMFCTVINKYFYYLFSLWVMRATVSTTDSFAQTRNAQINAMFAIRKILFNTTVKRENCCNARRGKLIKRCWLFLKWAEMNLPPKYCIDELFYESVKVISCACSIVLEVWGSFGMSLKWVLDALIKKLIWGIP